MGLPLPHVGKKASHAWHALDDNEYTHLNIAISENSFLGVLELLAMALTRDMESTVENDICLGMESK